MKDLNLKSSNTSDVCIEKFSPEFTPVVPNIESSKWYFVEDKKLLSSNYTLNFEKPEPIYANTMEEDFFMSVY